MKLEKVAAEKQEIHPKGWGKEIWIENIPEYCGKILVFEAGKKCSMHFHSKKKETMFLQSGRMTIELIEPESGKGYSVELEPGDSILIPPNQLHQICAVEDSLLFEFSTKHEDSDSYRAWKGD